MVPGVAGSNPVIRPSYKNTGVSAGIFITPVGSRFEPAKKPFEPPQKGGRKYAGCAHAQFCKVMKHSEIIRLSAPEIKNRPTGVFLFLCKDTDSNRGSHTLSLSLRRTTPTLKTLAYDCGNPVQYVCGRSPALSCHSRAGGNRAWVVIGYSIGGILLCCVFIIMKSAIQTFLDPIPAYAGMTEYRE